MRLLTYFLSATAAVLLTFVAAALVLPQYAVDSFQQVLPAAGPLLLLAASGAFFFGPAFLIAALVSNYALRAAVDRWGGIARLIAPVVCSIIFAFSQFVAVRSMAAFVGVSVFRAESHPIVAAVLGGVMGAGVVTVGFAADVLRKRSGQRSDASAA